MKPAVSTTPIRRAIAAWCVLTFWCITTGSAAAEPVVIERDLPDLAVAEKAHSYVIQAANVDVAAAAVVSVGGTVTSDDRMFQAVRATLLPPQVELLKRRSDVHRVVEETTVKTSSNAT